VEEHSAHPRLTTQQPQHAAYTLLCVYSTRTLTVAVAQGFGAGAKFFQKVQARKQSGDRALGGSGIAEE